MKQTTFNDPDNYSAISLWQPWAGLVWLAGMGWPGKTIESRGRPLHQRGPLVVCAGLKYDRDAYRDALTQLVSFGDVPPDVFEAACGVYGVALARFYVKDCRPLTVKDKPRTFFWKDDKPRFAWVANDIAALEPFSVKGSQGFFRLPRAQVDAAVLAHTFIDQR